MRKHTCNQWLSVTGSVYWWIYKKAKHINRFNNTLHSTLHQVDFHTETRAYTHSHSSLLFQCDAFIFFNLQQQMMSECKKIELCVCVCVKELN